MPQVEPQWLTFYGQVALTGQANRIEYQVKAVGRWFTSFAARVGGEGSLLVAIVFDDITPRKKHEQRQAFLLTLSDALRPLTNPVTIQGEAARVLGEHLQAGRTYYGTIDYAQQAFLVEQDYIRDDAPSVVGLHPFASFGPTFEAMQAHQPIIIEDTQTDPRIMEADRPAYAAIALRSFVTVPLVKGGQAVSAMAVVDVVPRQWSSEETALVLEVAARTWEAVERAKAEVAQRQIEQHIRLAVEGAQMAIWEWDLTTDQVYWNEQHFRLFGMAVQPNPLPSTAFIHRLHPDDAQAIKSQLQQTIEQRVLYDAEFRILRQDTGAVRWMKGHGQVTAEQDGQPVRVSGVMFEITDRKMADDALKVSDQRKDEFLAMLAHELRNPMSTLRSGLQILTLTDGKDETTGPTVGSTTIAMMKRQTEHLVRMVDDLLDVSRISQGKIELKTARIDLVALVKQATESLRALYEEQGKTVQVHLPTSPIYVEGDATRLSQVVSNLLTNGVRYTGEQGQVWLSLRHKQQDAILEVGDDGIGLTAAQLMAIFELFVQVDNSAARSKGGLGLGLTLVKRLVELHGGSVEAQSEGLGKGSTFRVHLPTLERAPQTSSISFGEATRQPVSSRILVIDDNADAALTLSILLKLKGYEVHTRNSGLAGIEAAQALQPAAILLDIGMPQMDGYETCRLIREQPWGKALVIIALTGYGQEEDYQRTQQVGFTGHLVKPVDLDALTGLLTNLPATGGSSPQAH